MATALDTFSLDGFRRDRDLPIAAVESYTHPEAVEAARARIAELPETFPLENAHDVPTAATQDLITSRERLRATLTAEPAAKSRPILPSVIQPVLTAVGIFLLILIVFKSPVILSQISYAFHKTPATASIPASNAAASIIPTDPSITIPKINVHAPVVYEPSTNETTFENALQNGVVHYGNTAVPGQNGNVAIFGHSSNDWWQPGNYKFVFVLLDKLAPGDQILIDYQGTRYTYEVTGSSVVDPTDVAVLNATPTPTLSLITCTPPGTSWKRLVVTAKQIDPNPNAAVSTPTTAAAGKASLPSGSSNLGSQAGNAWSSLVNSFKSLFGMKPNPTTTPKSSTSNQPSSLPSAN
ncbi:class D sortase [Candidatus Saccharibacteria bacterium]|nr:class D sortase [Candidatus Saccharibacteria bacterium]